jgi:hypothetical protein
VYSQKTAGSCRKLKAKKQLLQPLRERKEQMILLFHRVYTGYHEPALRRSLMPILAPGHFSWFVPELHSHSDPARILLRSFPSHHIKKPDIHNEGMISGLLFLGLPCSSGRLFSRNADRKPGDTLPASPGPISPVYDRPDA